MFKSYFQSRRSSSLKEAIFIERKARKLKQYYVALENSGTMFLYHLLFLREHCLYYFIQIFRNREKTSYHFEKINYCTSLPRK